MGSYSTKKYSGKDFIEFDNSGNQEINNFYLSPVLYAKLIFFKRDVEFEWLSWYQIDLVQTINWRYTIDASLNIPIWNNIYAKLGLNNFYENINLVGKEGNDIFLTYG